MIAQNRDRADNFPNDLPPTGNKMTGDERRGGGGEGRREKSYTSSRLRWTKRIERRSYGEIRCG